jgi:predicted alpha/beta-fold hydrolase
MNKLSTLSGHFWTLWPTLRQRLAPLSAPGAEHWSTRFMEDGRQVTLRGLWREEPCTVAVVVVHGLGGDPSRPYCVRAARAISAHGWSCLRLALRGADRQSNDFYHAGLHQDLAATIGSPALRPYDRIVILGYSLGGHVALRYACERPDPRVRAVTAICSPLDLDRAAHHLDESTSPLYRRHVLRGLRSLYAEVAARGPVPTPPAELEAVDRIRDWDRLTVCPRFGFEDPEAYYASESVNSRLRDLHVPALLLVSRNDPMLRLADVESAIEDANALFEVRRIARGGHVGFPPNVDLGEDSPPGLERQVLRWMERKLR